MTDSHPHTLAPSATDLTPLPEAAASPPAVIPPDEPAPAHSTELALPPSETPFIDAHGFDPAEFRWVPVRRKPRRDGWSEAKQRLFIEVLADTACVESAAAAAKMSVRSAYALRRAPGGEAFAAAWAAAQQQGALKLADVAFQRALMGTEEPVFSRDGIKIGSKTRYSERLMMFLLRAHLPERYAQAHRGERPIGAPPVPETPRVSEALARLAPAPPPEPHKLMPPAELDSALEAADILDGKLPRALQAVGRDPRLMPFGATFERRLEWAKYGIDTDDGGNPVAEEPKRKHKRAHKRSRPELS